jgi:HAD superfamily hydrolase (TIGR01490 family)
MTDVLANLPASARTGLKVRRKPKSGMRISVFDLDRTLTRRPTYSLFLLRTAWRVAPWRLLLIPLLLPAAIAYALKLLPRKRMKELMHALLLGRLRDRVVVRKVAEAFARDLVADGLYPAAVEQVRREAAAGRHIVLATAAPALYAAPLGRYLGVADVVATRATWQADQLTSRISGENCHGREKRRKLQRLLRRRGVRRCDAHIRFFSDDISDLPSFEWCDEAIAVNPRAPLNALARARKWRVLDWRHNHGLAE